MYLKYGCCIWQRFAGQVVHETDDQTEGNKARPHLIHKRCLHHPRDSVDPIEDRFEIIHSEKDNDGLRNKRGKTYEITPRERMQAEHFGLSGG
jgi:hypothetical protein